MGDQFASPLEASSYFHPCAPSPYDTLRRKVVDKAVQMGYDYDSLTEIPVDWSSDQDPNNHVSNPVYAKYTSTGNMRLFESFSVVMGDKYGDMFKGKGIGPVLKGYQCDLKRPAAYPDAVSGFLSILCLYYLSLIRVSNYFRCLLATSSVRSVQIATSQLRLFGRSANRQLWPNLQGGWSFSTSRLESQQISWRRVSLMSRCMHR